MYIFYVVGPIGKLLKFLSNDTITKCMKKQVLNRHLNNSFFSLKTRIALFRQNHTLVLYTFFSTWRFVLMVKLSHKLSNDLMHVWPLKVYVEKKVWLKFRIVYYQLVGYMSFFCLMPNNDYYENNHVLVVAVKKKALFLLFCIIGKNGKKLYIFLCCNSIYLW